MNKSFLELLEAEKRAFLDVKYFRESAIDFLNKAEMEVDPEIMEAHKRIASEYQERALKAEKIFYKLGKK